MYKGTTPTIPIRFENVNLVEAKVVITLYDEQKKTGIDFVSGRDFLVSQDGYDSTTSIALTQEQTLAFGTGLIAIQARFIYPDGSVGATQRESVQMQDVLNKEVLRYD